MIIAIDGSIGTDVNNDSKSKDIIHTSGLSWMPSMLCMKSMLFLTWCDEPSTRGLMILANSLAVVWVTDPMLDIIGLSGIPGLYTLGNPLYFGGTAPVGYSLLYVLSSTPPSALMVFSRAINLFLYLFVGSVFRIL